MLSLIGLAPVRKRQHKNLLQGDADHHGNLQVKVTHVTILNRTSREKQLRRENQTLKEKPVLLATELKNQQLLNSV